MVTPCHRHTHTYTPKHKLLKFELNTHISNITTKNLCIGISWYSWQVLRWCMSDLLYNFDKTNSGMSSWTTWLYFHLLYEYKAKLFWGRALAGPTTVGTRGSSFPLALRPHFITSGICLSILMFEILQGQISQNENEQMHQQTRQTDLFRLMFRDTEAEVYEL